jgi:methylated-DNA-[protein]-cysteine S-methyltransferase
MNEIDETEMTKARARLRQGGLGAFAEATPHVGLPLPPSIRELARRAADRVVEAAEEQDLLDVAYGFADSPFGRLLVAVTPRGLVRLSYPELDPDGELQELAAEVSPRILRSAKATESVRRELDEYFEGRRQEFDVAVDFGPMRGFRRRVLEQTARIPFGSVVTYRDVATGAGSPRAVRAAGNALGSNPVPIVVPCHRVVRTGGGLGGYTGGLDRKQRLLALEGALAAS